MKSAIFYVLLFVYTLLDAQTVVSGSIEGVRLAVFAVVPSLFPFIFLSVMSSYGISGLNISMLRPIEKLCGIPRGCGNLLLLGLCGGYPVGAQCISGAYKQGTITKKDGERLLGFCNNAGPSFIFGMVGGILKDVHLCWALWIGQILSAVIVGAILPGKSSINGSAQPAKKLSVTTGLESTIHICSKIAAWIILFRALISVAEKWFLSKLPAFWNAGISGVLELSNGCIRLQNIDSPLLRFLLCGILLSLGGFCVYLQTKSVTGTLSLRRYIIGKVLQTVILLPILLVLWKITVAF